MTAFDVTAFDGHCHHAETLEVRTRHLLLCTYTVEPPNKIHLGISHFVSSVEVRDFLGFRMVQQCTVAVMAVTTW